MSEELKPCPFCGNDPAPYWKGVGCATSGCLLNGLRLDADKWNRRAQPAGVGVVAEAYSHRSRDSMKVTVMNIRQIGRLRDGDKLVRQTDHLAALSAVTAGRDRLLQEKGDPAGSFEKCMQAMRDRDEHAKTIDQLRAEVEGLLGAMRQIRYASNNGPVSENNAGCIRRIEQIADAAMAAKEA